MNGRVRLICLHHAGGGASAFRSWPRLLPPDVDLLAAQAPGRETRLNERPHTSIESLVTSALAALIPWMDRPFALFGHSLGALVAFETARAVARAHLPGPSHLFVSGCRAPHLIKEESKQRHLPDDDLVKRLRSYAGTPSGVLDNPELMRLVLPALRADLVAAETYRCQSAPPLTCPITACGGTEDDDVSSSDLDAWAVHTTAAFERVMFQGGHFYLVEAEPAVVELVVARLRPGLQ